MRTMIIFNSHSCEVIQTHTHTDEATAFSERENARLMIIDVQVGSSTRSRRVLVRLRTEGTKPVGITKMRRARQVNPGERTD